MTQALPPFPSLPLDAALETYCDDLQERQSREPGLTLTSTQQQLIAWSNFEATCECAGLGSWVESGGYLAPLSALTELLVRCQHTPDQSLNRQAYALYTGLLHVSTSRGELPRELDEAFKQTLQGFWPRMSRWMCAELIREQYVREALNEPDPIAAYCQLSGVVNTQPHSAVAHELLAWMRWSEQLALDDLRGWLTANDGRQGPLHDALGRLNSSEHQACAAALGWELVHAARAQAASPENGWPPETWQRVSRRCQDLSAQLDPVIRAFYTELLRVNAAGEA